MSFLTVRHRTKEFTCSHQPDAFKTQRKRKVVVVFFLDGRTTQMVGRSSLPAPRPMKRDVTVDDGVLVLTCLRDHQKYVDQYGFSRPITLFNVAIEVSPSPKEKGDSVEQAAQKRAEHYLAIVRDFATKSGIGYIVSAAIAETRARHEKDHACFDHSQDEPIWIPIHGLDPAGRPSSGMLSVCSTCGARNYFDSEVRMEDHRIVEPTPQLPADPPSSPAKRARKKSSQGTHPAAHAAT